MSALGGGASSANDPPAHANNTNQGNQQDIRILLNCVRLLTRWLPLVFQEDQESVEDWVFWRHDPDYLTAAGNHQHVNGAHILGNPQARVSRSELPAKLHPDRTPPAFQSPVDESSGSARANRFSTGVDGGGVALLWWWGAVGGRVLESPPQPLTTSTTHHT